MHKQKTEEKVLTLAQLALVNKIVDARLTPDEVKQVREFLNILVEKNRKAHEQNNKNE